MSELPLTRTIARPARALAWLGAMCLLVAMGPVLTLGPGIIWSPTGTLTPLLILLAISLAASILGFLWGPLAFLWCLYLAVKLLILGLSEEHRYFLCCTSKDRFEAELVALLPVFVFPGAALSCWLICNRIWWKRPIGPAKVALFVVVSALAAHGVLWLFHSLETIVQCDSVRCRGG